MARPRFNPTHPDYHLRIKYGKIKRRAKIRELPITLTLDEFRPLFEAECVYCGAESTGLDRIDSSKGYTSDNVVPACHICNTMKWTLTTDVFLAHCRQIVRNVQD
jgi:hypothetical protein